MLFCFVLRWLALVVQASEKHGVTQSKVKNIYRACEVCEILLAVAN